MAQDELDKKLRDILVEVSQKMYPKNSTRVDKAIVDIKLLFQDAFLEECERTMVSRRKENLETSEQLTLGELIAQLEKIPHKDLPVIFDSRYHPTGLSSWRGGYGELAIEYDSAGRRSPLSDFLEMLKGAIGKTYEGYKGGSYKMRSDTPLWVANYGTTMGFRRGEDGDDYQAVSGILWNDKHVIIDTTLSLY